MQVIDEFKRKHGRVPSFWLDKVCIDQSKITESLRALPIFLVSCKRMLIIAGPTYIHRLWYVMLTCVCSVLLLLLCVLCASCSRSYVPWCLDVRDVHRCIWELHMLFVSAGGSSAVDGSIYCIGDTASAFHVSLAKFEMCRAQCYDPNEVGVASL